MESRKRSRDSSDKENWEIIFKTLFKILRQKEDQLESLVMRWKLLEDRIKTQHEASLSHVKNYEDKIKMTEMTRLVEIATCNLLHGFKERDIFSCKSKLEHSQAELDDFRALFDLLILKTNKEICDSGDEDCDSLEVIKIRKLKLKFEKLAFGKTGEVSTLLRDTGFALNRFKRIQSGFTGKLMRKDEEIKRANKKISSLEDQLQSSNHEKDKIISALRAKVAEIEDNAGKKDDEISRSSHEGSIKVEQDTNQIQFQKPKAKLKASSPGTIQIL